MSLPSLFSVNIINGSNGFVVEAENTGDGVATVASGGDFNGDGYIDLLVGASQYDITGTDDVGAVYVIYGSTAGFPASFDLSTLDGSNGFVLEAEEENAGFASVVYDSLSFAGDINGDGFDDFIVGARLANGPVASDAGKAFVVYGTDAGMPASLGVGDLDGSNGFVMNGADQFNYLGRAVSDAGDVNGDGIDDFIVGATGADPYSSVDAGQSYVVFGTTSGWGASFSPLSLNGTNGFAINGAVGSDINGASVSSAGDVNGDGFDDLLVGSPAADPNSVSGSGSAYIVFGAATGWSSYFSLNTIDGTNGVALNGEASQDRLGEHVSGIGDINGDGYDDVAVSTQNANRTYVVFGKETGWSANLNLSTLDGTDGFYIDGEDAFDAMGFALSGAGDVDGDGFEDFLVSAVGHTQVLPDDGAVYLIYGRAVGTWNNIDFSSYRGATKIYGSQSNHGIGTDLSSGT